MGPTGPGWEAAGAMLAGAAVLRAAMDAELASGVFGKLGLGKTFDIAAFGLATGWFGCWFGPPGGPLGGPLGGPAMPGGAGGGGGRDGIPAAWPGKVGSVGGGGGGGTEARLWCGPTVSEAGVIEGIEGIDGGNGAGGAIGAFDAEEGWLLLFVCVGKINGDELIFTAFPQPTCSLWPSSS